jgi:hypothetical protein
MTTSCGTPPAGSDRNPKVAGPWSSTTVPTILTHSPGCRRCWARARCARTCSTGMAAAASCGLSYHHRSCPDITHTSTRRRERERPVVRDFREGRLTSSCLAWICADLNRPRRTLHRVLRPTSYSARGGHSPMLRNDAGCFAPAPSPSEAGMNDRRRHPVGCGEVDRHETKVSRSGDTWAPVGSWLRSVGLTAAV